MDERKELKVASASTELGNTYRGSETVYRLDPAAKTLEVLHTRLGDKRSSKTNFSLDMEQAKDLWMLLDSAFNKSADSNPKCNTRGFSE